MKAFWAAAAVILFHVMTFGNATELHTTSPEQGVLEAMQSPQAEAWFDSVLAPGESDAPRSNLPSPEYVAFSAYVKMHRSRAAAH